MTISTNNKLIEIEIVCKFKKRKPCLIFSNVYFYRNNSVVSFCLKYGEEQNEFGRDTFKCLEHRQPTDFI